MKGYSMIIRKRKAIAVVFGILLLFFLVDWYVGSKERAIIREREAERERLEKLAFFMIFPDISDVKDIKDKPERYEAIIKVENLTDEPVYITHPEVRAYVQTGTFWTEVPVHEDKDEKKEQIYRIDHGIHFYKKVVTINRNIRYTYYMMPYYMHIRFHISFFVLPESAFKEETGTPKSQRLLGDPGEVVERYTDVYIYLKPYFVDKELISKELKFPDNNVPVMIPMPPH